jgi:ribosomal protein S18 acetylase RimI-like enzyme
MIPSITRRPASEQDGPFLWELFQAVRMADFAHLPMPPAQLEMLLRMQFQAQTVGYRAQYPNANHEIVLCEGRPAGRILVDRAGTEFQLVDISLGPAHQGQGIGTALVTGLIEEARSAGVPLCCSVATNNPGSLRFHQRLGFRVVAQDAVYYRLERPPAP